MLEERFFNISSFCCAETYYLRVFYLTNTRLTQNDIVGRMIICFSFLTNPIISAEFIDSALCFATLLIAFEGWTAVSLSFSM